MHSLSANPYYNLIEDVYLATLERTDMPLEVEISLPEEQVRALIKAGLFFDGQVPVPEDQKVVSLLIAGHSLTLRVECNEPEEVLERIYH